MPKQFRAQDLIYSVFWRRNLIHACKDIIGVIKQTSIWPMKNRAHDLILVLEQKS